MAKKKLLGQLLIEKGIVTEAQLDEALKIQKTDPRKLGVILVELEIISRTKLLQLLAEQTEMFIRANEDQINEVEHLNTHIDT